MEFKKGDKVRLKGTKNPLTGSTWEIFIRANPTYKAGSVVTIKYIANADYNTIKEYRIDDTDRYFRIEDLMPFKSLNGDDNDTNL